MILWETSWLSWRVLCLEIHLIKYLKEKFSKSSSLCSNLCKDKVCAKVMFKDFKICSQNNLVKIDHIFNNSFGYCTILQRYIVLILVIRCIIVLFKKSKMIILTPSLRNRLMAIFGVFAETMRRKSHIIIIDSLDKTIIHLLTQISTMYHCNKSYNFRN